MHLASGIGQFPPSPTFSRGGHLVVTANSGTLGSEIAVSPSPVHVRLWNNLAGTLRCSHTAVVEFKRLFKNNALVDG